MKRGNRVLERGGRAAQPELQAGDLNGAPLKLRSAAYLSLRHAAEYLDLTEEALRIRVKRGTMPAWTYTRSLGSIRFIRTALDEFLQPKDRQATLDLIHGGKR